MADKRRALPSWMETKKEKVKENEPLKSRRKRKVAKAAFYCMNEKELVEAAVSFLTDGAREDAAPLADRKVEDKEGDTTVRTREKPASPKTEAKPAADALEEESSGCSDARETTYVSETDLDITEVETLPYATGQQRQVPGGQRSGPAQGHNSLTNVELEAERRAERSQTPGAVAEDDDALRLVREIFFT